jgi:hypothetical protein
VERVIERCLAKDPADRHANGREILLALEMIDASAPSLSNVGSVPASHAAPALRRPRPLGAARPRSVTAERALARMKALACTE